MHATDDPSNGPPSGATWQWGLLLVVVALVLVGLVVMTAPRGSVERQPAPAIGRTLPLLELEPLTGASTSVSRDDLKGRVTLVNFWGTWCPPCILEFPHIADLAARFGAHDDFRLYAVSCGTGPDEDPDTLRSQTQAFLETAKVDLPTYWDPDAATRRSLAAVTDAESMAYPTTLLIDRQGVVRGFWSGYARGTEREMQAAISQLLQ